MAEARLPLVAIVGRPNVGKSSLVNRILRRREAIVEESPGVTRDRGSWVAEWAGRRFEVMDTGGVEPGAEGLDARVADQARLAVDIADAVVLVVDATIGVHEDDLAVAELLRRSRKPVVVAVNKVDEPRDEAAAAEFYRLGLGDPIAVSALHGRGSGDLLESVIERLPQDSRDDDADDVWASLAIVGRPNVGKSSLLNALVGEERALVDATPGTTRDPVNSYLELHGGRTVRIVDTAGMRRQVQMKDPIEYFSYLRSRKTLERSDAALLVVDVSEGVTAADQRLAEEIMKSGRACVVVLNKWDLLAGTEEVDMGRAERDLRTRLRFIPWAGVVRTSALTRRGVTRVVPQVEIAVQSHRRRLTTAELNRIIGDAQSVTPHPRGPGGRVVRILYAVQARTAPPTIVLFATGRIDDAYVRYLERRVRMVHPFTGTPLHLQVRQKTAVKVEG